VRGTSVGALALLLLLAGCGSGDPDPESGPAADAVATPAGADPATTPWNPCADLGAGSIGTALAARVTEETGSADAPRCAFLPVEKGGPTLNVTYLWYDGGFDEAWASMGRIDGTVTDLDLAGADDARLVVNATRRAVLVTGFVKVGTLIETVNAVQLAPYDRGAVTGATTRVLRTLVRHAPASPAEADQRD
jgi:hypothetical protein